MSTFEKWEIGSDAQKIMTLRSGSETSLSATSGFKMILHSMVSLVASRTIAARSTAIVKMCR